MKTPEELKMLKAEVDALNAKLDELSPEELEKVIGGVNKKTTDDPMFVNTLLKENADVN